MGKTKDVVYVIGHKNPDTDSICSAISYAYLKSQTDDKQYFPRRAGRINKETEFVLNHFGVEQPEYMSDAATQVKEIEIHEIEGADSECSVREAWNRMNDQNVVTLPIITGENKLEGLITVSDIAKSYMDIYDSDILSQADTKYRCIADTLDGKILVGDPEAHFSKGRVVIGAFHPETMGNFIDENDLVIMGNRTDDQLCAMEKKASCIVVGLDAKISDLILKLAGEQGCTVITSPHDSYTIARLINQALPIRHLMKRHNLVTFHLSDPVDEIREVMKRLRHRDFPILDRHDEYVGTISRRNLIGARGKKIILVDHNEISQAVDHIEEAEIQEIIDHHRLGSIETMNPILFRNEPVGCTATIIYREFLEQQVTIPYEIAGLLMSAILSDTLMFRSPTCTDRDRRAAGALAKIAGVKDITEYASEMFRAGSDLSGKQPEEVFYQDFKRFEAEERKFGVGQVSSLDAKELEVLREELQGYLEKNQKQMGLDMVFFMLTNILTQTTEMIYCGEGAQEALEQAFHVNADPQKQICELKNIVSRKKQVIPPLISYLQEQANE